MGSELHRYGYKEKPDNQIARCPAMACHMAHSKDGITRNFMWKGVTVVG